MEKTITVDGKQVRLKASALIPRLYRFKFGRDMISDMQKLQKSYIKAASLGEDATEEERREAQLSIMDLTIFENVAYIMAKHADESLPSSPDEWLDSFTGVFDIYQVMPQVLELWGLNQMSTSTPKKNKTYNTGI